MATITIGKSDSMNTIQNKLNKAANGTAIFAKNVTFKITKQLFISENTVIELNGATLQRKGNIQSIFINKVAGTTTGYNGAGKITIKNGSFEGMGGYSYDNLLTFFHSHDISIINCTFRDILCHAIEINSTKNVLIDKCNFLGYNMENVSYSYRECIQIDHAGFSGLVYTGTSKSSKCYDGTCCNNIEISNCLFSKSNYRDYPYACIGEHCQLSGAKYKHKNIKIHDNEFYCKKNPDLKQACLSIISMEDVEVYDNYFDCYKVARIYSKNESYTLKGAKVTAKDGDGICKSVHIKNNKISGCTKAKEAFKESNLSGNIDHSDIIKKPNTYI